jgi:hypothetical protein
MKLMNDTIAPQDADTETNLAITEALAAAKTHQRAGRVRETASIFNKILSFDPDNIEALKGMAEISCITYLCKNIEPSSRGHRLPHKPWCNSDANGRRRSI